MYIDTKNKMHLLHNNNSTLDIFQFFEIDVICFVEHQDVAFIVNVKLVTRLNSANTVPSSRRVSDSLEDCRLY